MLVDERKPLGEYAMQFNAAALASGVYYYRMTVEGSTLRHENSSCCDNATGQPNAAFASGVGCYSYRSASIGFSIAALRAG